MLGGQKKKKKNLEGLQKSIYYDGWGGVSPDSPPPSCWGGWGAGAGAGAVAGACGVGGIGALTRWKEATGGGGWFALSKGEAGGGRGFFGASSRSPWISLYVGESTWITVSLWNFLKLMLFHTSGWGHTNTHRHTQFYKNCTAYIQRIINLKLLTYFIKIFHSKARLKMNENFTATVSQTNNPWYIKNLYLTGGIKFINI